MKHMYKRALALLLCLVLCLALLPSAAFATDEILIDVGDLPEEEEASWLLPPEDEIVLVDPEPEAPEAISVGTPLTGDLADGWQKIGGSWYYFRSGTAVTGWQKIGDYWYYFNGSGVMQTGWQKLGSYWYYFAEGGNMVTGWQKLGSYWYYFGSGGNMITGWQKIGSSWYYFGSGGNMITGWQKIDGRWYYFSSGGSMLTGWQKIGGSWYYFAEGGAMQTGWQKLNNRWYYFAESGAMQTGWQKLGSTWYYFASDGSMVTGWQKIGSYWYYFGEGGAMQTGWLQIGENWYYLKENGQMAANETVNGYHFDESGKWVRTVAPDAALTRENFLILLDAYDPDGAYLIRNSSESLAMEWFDDDATTIADGINDMGTSVHEQCHDFTHSGAGWNSEKIYIGNGRYTTVSYTDVFDSIEMVATVPESCRTFRFDTYVDTEEEHMSSRQDGIYGLFNEFTAYCWGFNCNCKLESYKQENGLSIRNSNEYVAYAEFRYYILHYMVYAKDNHPDVYNAILANDNFRTSFSIVDDTFGTLVDSYRKQPGRYLWCDGDFTALMTEMQKPEYVQMAALLHS